MTTINLKDFYYWYLTDVLVEVPDEVAEELIGVHFQFKVVIVGKDQRHVCKAEAISS